MISLALLCHISQVPQDEEGLQFTAAGVEAKLRVLNYVVLDAPVLYHTAH